MFCLFCGEKISVYSCLFVVLNNWLIVNINVLPILRCATSYMREAHLQAVTIVTPYRRLLVLGTTPIILSNAFSSETRGAVDDEMHCQRASRSVRMASMISCGV